MKKMLGIPLYICIVIIIILSLALYSSIIHEKESSEEYIYEGINDNYIDFHLINQCSQEIRVHISVDDVSVYDGYLNSKESFGSSDTINTSYKIGSSLQIITTSTYGHYKSTHSVHGDLIISYHPDGTVSIYRDDNL